MICVSKGTKIHELFHRQDFFFFNYAFKGSYGAVSFQSNNQITINEGECYIGQPYAGYAINNQSEEETIIVGVLIRSDVFFKKYLHVLSAVQKLFQFFLNPQISEYSEEYMHFKFEDQFTVQMLLELMIVEYANRQETTQEVLSPLALALFMQVARQYKIDCPSPEGNTLVEKILQYIGSHMESVSLNSIAAHFSYHPNYISSLIHKELGKPFTVLINELRMNRAVALLKGTSLSNEEIATMLGYSNSSNFYKAFKGYYHCSPREYVGGES